MSGYPEGSRDFTQLLGPGVGYGLVVGAGAFFAIFMSTYSTVRRFPYSILRRFLFARY